MSVFLSVFFFLCMVTIVCRSYSSGLSRVSSLFYGKGELSWFFRIKKRLINATDRSFEKHEMLDCRCYWQHSHEVGRNVACVAWRFWLGALSNKGGRGQRNREEIGAEATWSNLFFSRLRRSCARLNKTAMLRRLDAMRIIYTLNEPRLTCSLFLSKLICSPVIGIIIHLGTLKIWVS